MTDLHQTEWTNVCGCVMVYEWDRDLPDIQRVHTVTQIKKRCSEHPSQATTSDQQHYDRVLEESQRWNFTLGTALDNLTSQLADVDVATGSLTLKKNITFNWSFTGTFPNRVCTISFIGISLTNQQKNALQQKCNQLFGSGKVAVQ